MLRRVVISRHHAVLTSLVLLALVAACALLATASAQEVPRLTERVTDETGSLGDTSDIEQALADLEADENVQLWVLFVDTTGSLTSTGYADAVAEANSFGGNDALVVIALDDRTDALWVGPLLDEVSDDEIDRLLANELEPNLADGDFSAAVVELANGLGEAVSGDVTGDTGNGDDGGGGTSFLTIIVIIALIGAIVLGVWWFTKRRGEKRAAEERDRQTGQLARQANSLLLEVDDDLREAKQEIGFAEAQFSEEDVAPFRTALASAQDEMQAAFAIRQKLDDSVPEDPPTRRSMLEQIVKHAEQAKALLAEQRTRIEELRDLERRAPEILSSLGGQVDAAEARIPEVTEQYRKLQSYADTIWKPLEGNIVEAQKRFAYAREAAAAGQATDNHQQAAAAARGGQAALAEGVTLLDAIDHQAEAVRSAAQSIDQELAAADADVRAARAALADGRTEGAEELARAEALLASARREAGAARPDILAAVRMAQEANSGADAVLAGVRAAEERRQREAAAFQGTLQRAETAYRQAADYVLGGRRRSIGREARTRLAEAERHLAAARDLQSSDLKRATSEAQEAERLASDAMRLAERDFGGRSRRPPTGGGMSGSDIMGGVLGGILGNILIGGMRGGGGGFGGTSWGSPGSSRSRGGGFKFPSGGMGGFGGGGGRSRGGRW